MSVQAATKLTLNSRKIYIIPTRWGILYSIMVLVLLLLAMNYKISLAYYLAFLLVALGVTAILHTWLNMLGLTIEPHTIKPTFSGDYAVLNYRIKNHQPRVRYAIGMYVDKQEVNVQTIEQQATFSVPIKAQKRGWQSIPKVTLFSIYPLGLLHAWAHVPHGMKLLVYPKPSDNQEVALAIDVGTNDMPTSKATLLKGEDDFNGHRAYQKGDPIKRIDWKASSKNEHLLSKEYSADQPEIIWFDWSLIEENNKELRVSLLTKAIIDAHLANSTYGMRLPKAGFEPSNTVAHYHACLKALALI